MLLLTKKIVWINRFAFVIKLQQFFQQTIFSGILVFIASTILLLCGLNAQDLHVIFDSSFYMGRDCLLADFCPNFV